MPFEPLAARTEATYRKLLSRAIVGYHVHDNYLGQDRRLADIQDWPASCKQTLRAALKWAGQDDLAAQIGKLRLRRREPIRPTEDEISSFEQVAADQPKGKRALLLLQLHLGLRAQGLLQLERERIKYALRTGKLVFLNKGGAERILPVGSGVKSLLQDLLATPGANGKPWQLAGQVLSAAGGPHTQYQLYRRLLIAVGKQAGLARPHTHMARHAHATRMHNQGADLRTIQAALQHESPATTAKYVHPELEEILKYQR